jgi:PDZ domain-containing secreted protein
VVPPQPAIANAIDRASATLIQRLVFFFKIPYLNRKRGACRGVNEMMAVAGRPEKEQENLLSGTVCCTAYDYRSITKLAGGLARRARVA